MSNENNQTKKASAFDKVIGYETIKKELFQICDMIHHKEKYKKIGASLPKGLILYGNPGLGKTLLSTAFIEESGIPSYTIRRNKGEGDFIAEIADTFAKAKENAPCIVFLDDLDKFANEDEKHRDAKEYVAVQAGIDDVAQQEVFVIATANDMDKLPESLVRSGRFDRTIEIEKPDEEDAEKIIKYYLSNKPVSPSVNFEDLSKMIRYSSCAELETILNEAAIIAAYSGNEQIEMNDLVSAVLRQQYDSPDEAFTVTDDDEARRTAIHEAGHLVCSEVLCPESVGLASIRPNGRSHGTGGFIYRCKDLRRRPHFILVALASKAAVELYYADHVAAGCSSDLKRAAGLLREGILESATSGFGMINGQFRPGECSESLSARREAVVSALLEQYFLKSKDIMIKNRSFLEKIADELVQKGTLLYSDIHRIKESVTITPVAV